MFFACDHACLEQAWFNVQARALPNETLQAKLAVNDGGHSVTVVTGLYP